MCAYHRRSLAVTGPNVERMLGPTRGAIDSGLRSAGYALGGAARLEH